MIELSVLSKKYPDVDPYILAHYKDAQTEIIYNDDPDLDIIKVQLPSPPEDWTKIEGFGLMPKDQFFKRQEYPRKLRELEDLQDDDGNFLNQDEIWERINEDFDYYKDEVDWVNLQWHRRLYGYWFFNNGQPTYIDGWHYFYLNFWEIDIGLPGYRDRDRRFFIFARFCYNDKKCYGFIYPKHRREGATYKAGCINYQIISMLERGHSGTQSMTSDHAEIVFQKHIIDPWKTGLPFFFKPNHSGGDDPKAILAFRPSASRGNKGSKKNSKKALLSSITFTSSNVKAYDTWKLHFYHQDELGKTEECDVNDRWAVVKPCLAQGAGEDIHGFSLHTSTVGEMEKGGGKNMLRLCKKSMYSQRNKIGQTKSGLYILFMPACDGLDGFIDKFGMSVIDDPTPEQAEYIGKNYGAREHIQSIIEGNGTDEADDFDINEFIRQHPLYFKACFKGATTESGFDIRKIEDRLENIRLQRGLTSRGNFVWAGERFKSRVLWEPDPENGLFYNSLVLPPEQSNRIIRSDDTFYAENLSMCAGSDPFKFNKTKGKRKSDGAGAVFWGHDTRTDPFDKDVKYWESNRFICTYSNRVPDKLDYAEDMLKMTIYYGCPHNTEMDVPLVSDFFELHGYEGLLMHPYEKGKHIERGGTMSGGSTKQRIFASYMTYINRHCGRERHMEILEQCRDIDGPEDMTNYDLFAAGGYAMIGLENFSPLTKEAAVPEIDISEYAQEYIYQ